MDVKQHKNKQTRTPPTAATPAWRPPKAARVLDKNSSATPFHQRGERGTTRHTAHVGSPRQASQPLTEGRGQRDSTEATPDHRSSAVSANNTNNSDSEVNDSSVTDEQRGSASVTICASVTTARLTRMRVKVTRQRRVAAVQSVTVSRGLEVLAGASPSQGRIDTMFHTQRSANEESNVSAKSNNTGRVDGSDADDTDALFDDAADT